ncbi:hypothetical protein TRFO_09325 [Tritrichomonas foetus]|uniref:Doublecortin domain-containing protein n=1 Tax=Tritrichomonas foetus TaxID=1144522 RepID=A0A1J4JEU3_9EUKA|nr:hypothetical protein TRFO_09325 [Tritrichomonas foetus]|eukprot:OHS97624.1 hypothetical protein TRFO_09325 [Tritrichomonas foetus]
MSHHDSDSPALNEENLQHSDGYPPQESAADEDSNLSPRSKALKRKSLSQRQAQGILVQVVRNAYPRSDPKRYRLFSLDKLLKESMQLVGLNAQAKKIFNKDGCLVKSIDEVNDGDVLYISSGEKFAYGISPVKRQLPKYEPVESPKEEHKPDTPTKTKSEIRQENKQNRFQHEVLSFQRIVAVTQKTVDENLRESTASVYAALLENQRRRLPNWYQLQYAHDETQQARLIEHLINLKICPTSANVIPEVYDWSMDLFRGIEVDDIRFVITGPRQSGKTTLLHSTASTLMRKLQCSDEASKYLFFPFNFEIESLELNNHNHLLKLFMKIAFEALEYCHLAFLPLISQLRKWFTLSVFGTQMQYPTGISQFEGVNEKALKELAKKLHSSLQAKDGHSIENFVTTLCELPSQLAKALGLSGVIYIFDNFDYASEVFLTPGENCFPDSLKPVSLCQALCNELQNNLYIVSLQDEQRFLECFTCDNAALLDTEGILNGSQTVTQNNVSIVVRQPPLRLSVDNCLGCPGYVARFERLCELVKRMELNSAVPSQYAIVKTSSDRSRLSVVKQEIVRLSELLSDAGSTVITKDLLNRLIDQEAMNVKYVTPASHEEEEEEVVEETKPSPPPQEHISDEDVQD